MNVKVYTVFLSLWLGLMGFAQAVDFNDRSNHRVVEKVFLIATQDPVTDRLQTWCDAHQEHQIKTEDIHYGYVFQCKHFLKLCPDCSSFAQFIELSDEIPNFVIADKDQYDWIKENRNVLFLTDPEEKLNFDFISLVRLDPQNPPRLMIIQDEDESIQKIDRQLLYQKLAQRFVLFP